MEAHLCPEDPTAALQQCNNVMLAGLPAKLFQGQHAKAKHAAGFQPSSARRLSVGSTTSDTSKFLEHLELAGGQLKS